MPATLSVFLNAKNVTRSLEFYKALGFKVDHAAKGDDGEVYYADLSFQGAEVGLGHIPSNDEPEFVQWVSTPLGAGVVVYITTKGVDRVYAKAQAAGATIEHPPQDRFYGRLFTLNDPDGYVLTFIDDSKVKKEKAAATKKKPARKTGAVKKAARAAPKRAAAKKAKAPAKARGGAAKKAKARRRA